MLSLVDVWRGVAMSSSQPLAKSRPPGQAGSLVSNFTLTPLYSHLPNPSPSAPPEWSLTSISQCLLHIAPVKSLYCKVALVTTSYCRTAQSPFSSAGHMRLLPAPRAFHWPRRECAWYLRGKIPLFHIDQICWALHTDAWCWRQFSWKICEPLQIFLASPGNEYRSPSFFGQSISE